jgi:hypothetical protein
VGNWITLTGVKPYDGRYELDLDGQPLTRREWGWIKRLAGYLPVTLTGESFTDPELITMLAIISMHRAGRITNEQVPEVWDLLADVPFGSTITLEADETEDAEGDAGPPPSGRSEKPSSNGESSPTGSVTSGNPPSVTGSPAWVTSGSVPPISVS